MKKQICFLVMICCLSLTLSGCGNGSSRDAANENGANYAMNNGDIDGGNYDGSAYDTENQGASESYDSDDVSDETIKGDVSEAGNQEKTSSKQSSADSDVQTKEATSKIKKEMLVYRGNVSIDTLDFEKSVSDFKKMLDKAGGFVETESYSDDGSYTNYYIDESEERHNTYTATVRVPSSKYDSMLNDAGELGDVRKKSSNAENVTQKYSTYQSELQVYQAQYDRYLKMLEETKDEKVALDLQNQLFQLQIKIADLKAGITNIETDVSYSYIDMIIREVRRYQDEPVQKDTFLQRLSYTCKDSWRVFLNFLEGVLFLIIRLWYYIVIILVILYFVRKFHNKRAEKKRMKQGAQRMPNGMPGGVLPNGMPGGIMPNGMPVGTMPNGMPGGILPNGMPVGTMPNGTPGGAVPNGMPGGSIPDGTPVEAVPNGVSKGSIPDGTPIEAVPNGASEGSTPDGTPVEAVPNGVSEESIPDGTPVEVVPNGVSKENVPDDGTTGEIDRTSKEMPDETTEGEDEVNKSK